MAAHTRTARRTSIILALGLACAAFSSFGCKKDNWGYVEGAVTCDGKPFSGNQIVFSDPERGYGASAALDENGAFQLIGPLKPGQYLVVLVPPSVSPRQSAAEANKAPEIPEKYRSFETTPLKMELSAGRQRFEADLKSD